MDSFNDVFLAAKSYCHNKLADATYSLYIEDLEPVSFDPCGIVTISVRNAFYCGIVKDRYQPLLTEAFKSVLGFEVQFKFTIRDPSLEDDWFAPAPVDELPPPSPKHSASYEFTFENFIKGSSNQFAYSAAQAVASNPSGTYNPLFIYGQSGLGKTHLLNAILAQVHKTHPDYVTLYIDCETFTNEIITAIKDGTTEQFRMKYRRVDVLLVDDIQFIAGKESTQEEFFHTFNSLHSIGKQIVLASDRPPREIKSLEERLRTRFEWGLCADVQPPDFETRVAIVRSKAQELNFALPDDVADYIANNLKNNIRQLEGAVKKMNAYYILEGIQPVITVAQNAIKDILNETQPIPLTLEKIENEVARTYSVSTADLKSTKRTANISLARQTAIYIVREITGMSMEDIGKEFGGRDHSTIVYSLKTFEASLAKDSRLREMVEDLIKNIRQ